MKRDCFIINIQVFCLECLSNLSLSLSLSLCVRACVRACVRGCVYVYVFDSNVYILAPTWKITTINMI